MTAVVTLPPVIRSYLADFISRTRWMTLARRLGMSLAAFLGWLLLWCAIDRFAQLPAGVRLAALAVGVAFVIARITPCITMLWKHADWIAAASQVESHNPRFDQRLQTVTSRLLGSTEYRGSDEILIRLTREVTQQVASERAGRLVPWRATATPWGLCLALALIIAALLGVHQLKFAALAERFFEPLAPIPPVTTTQLMIAPGDQDVVQSRPLTIAVRADRLGDSPVILYLNDDGRNWSHVVMPATGVGQFNFTLASIDRDLRYYIKGGDAESRQYFVRVLRSPAVSQFRIHYQYPSYTRLTSSTVTNSNGRIEAPPGTKVHLTIVSTEPLKEAIVAIGSKHVLMSHGKSENSASADFVVTSDANYSIDLISTREVSGSGPSGMSIHTIPDLPPIIRLARGGDSLRLNPREILPIHYEALDDYGLQSIVISAAVNGQDPVQAPAKIWGDPRRQNDVFNFDLATLRLEIGDVVKLTAVATDTAGHSTESIPLLVIVSPRSIDLAAWERIAELTAAKQLCHSLVLELDDALKAKSEGELAKDPESSAFLIAESKADRSLGAASQTASLLRQSLLRAISNSNSAQLSVALADWVDAAEVESTAADNAFRQGAAPGGSSPHSKEGLTAALKQAVQMERMIVAIEAGERAAAILADDQNLQAARKRPMPNDAPNRQRVRETIERMQKDIVTEAAQIGLNGSATDLDAQLRVRIAAGQAIVEAARPVDFVEAATKWASEIEHNPQPLSGLQDRILAAVQAEAVRPDANLIHARDLELAVRAIGAVKNTIRVEQGSIRRQSLNTLMADVQTLIGSPDAGKSSPDVALAQARQDLARLAGDGSLTASRATAPSADEQVSEIQSLAVRASAAAADHQYGQASALDQAMARRLEPQQKAIHGAAGETDPAAPSKRVEHHQQIIQHEMAQAHVLDDLGRRQQMLATAVAATQPDQAADQQQDVAERIAGVEQQRQEDAPGYFAIGENGRDRATAEVLAAQAQLSSMPQALAVAQAAAADRREAAARAQLSNEVARHSPADQRSAAERAAAEAGQDALDAEARLTQLIDPISPTTIQVMAERLEPFAPETDASRSILIERLAPSLQELDEALRGTDAQLVAATANDARQAMEAAQRELGAAQDVLVQHDPLVAARWFAKAAADALSMLPPDLVHAKSHQINASAALSRAWNQSIHKAAAERLSVVPSMAAILRTEPSTNDRNGARQGLSFAAAREWSRLRAQDPVDLTPAMHDADPAGYEESLKLYFEALGKAQDEK